MTKIFRISAHTLIIAILGSWLAVNAEEIGHNVNMPSNVIAPELWKMEKAGLITRKWADKYMFDIKKQREINLGICCISG
jgi:predicted transcriptional regulator